MRVDKSSERVDVEPFWVGGLVESHILSRPVGRSAMQADYPRLVERLQVWSAEGRSAAAMAESLNAEGFRLPKRAARFTREMVQRLLWHLKLARREPHGSLTGLGPDEYRPGGLACLLGLSRDTVRGWIGLGRVDDPPRRRRASHHLGRRVGVGPSWSELHGLRRNWDNRERFAELIQPKARPER